MYVRKSSVFLLSYSHSFSLSRLSSSDLLVGNPSIKLQTFVLLPVCVRKSSELLTFKEEFSFARLSYLRRTQETSIIACNSAIWKVTVLDNNEEYNFNYFGISDWCFVQ